MPHNVDNLVITCMDFRFQRFIRECLQEEYGVDIERSDRLALAGSSKAVVDGILLPQIQDSHRLHDIKNVYVIDHLDCGGFGGQAAFDNDEQKETAAHIDSLDRAADAIHKILPQIIVVTNIIGLDGQFIKSANGQ